MKTVYRTIEGLDVRDPYIMLAVDAAVRFNEVLPENQKLNPQMQAFLAGMINGAIDQAREMWGTPTGSK